MMIHEARACLREVEANHSKRPKKGARIGFCYQVWVRKREWLHERSACQLAVPCGCNPASPGQRSSRAHAAGCDGPQKEDQ
jgi:hypothetical protein